eukprot:644487-Prorocentrum_lima.AAC.1
MGSCWPYHLQKCGVRGGPLAALGRIRGYRKEKCRLGVAGIESIGQIEGARGARAIRADAPHDPVH